MESTQQELRILVVEDEPDIREMLLASLSGEAEVEAAADGHEALAKLAAGLSPSVILLDLRMPGLSGEGVLQALARLPVRPPVVTMSACSRPPPGGAVAHLAKPFSLCEAVDVLRRACCRGAPAPLQAPAEA
jgi:two-component system, OmpR family, response regulator